MTDRPYPAIGGRTCKSLWCRLGIHRWETRRNEEGQRYITCQRCRKENDKITLTDNIGGPM